MYWIYRNVGGNTWTAEGAYANREQSERAAKFYRADRHRRCVVVPVPGGSTRRQKLDALKEVVDR